MSVMTKLCATGLAMVAAAALLSAQAAEPFMAVGVWKLNPAKTTFVSSQASARSRIHTIEHRGGGVVVNKVEQVTSDGSTTTEYSTMRNDGAEYPRFMIRADGKAAFGTVSSTRVDEYTTKWEYKDAAGKVTASGTRTVSKDGRTYTLRGPNTTSGETVFERQ